MMKPVYLDTETTSHQIQALKRAASIENFNKTRIQAHFAQQQKITYPAENHTTIAY